MSNDKSDDLMSVISEAFAPAEVTPDSTLFDLGATSLSLLRLMASLQRRFDVALDVVDMYSVDSIGELVRLVEERRSTDSVA